MDNWDAIGAVGQWVAAAATFTAAWVALRQGRPMLDIRTFYARLEGQIGVRTRRDRANVLRIIVTNVGYSPVKISFFGFKAPRGYKMVSLGLEGEVPRWTLEPLGTADRIVDLQRLRDLGIDYDFCVVAIDVRGRHYWSKVGLAGVLRRWWFLCFGKPGDALKMSEKEPPVLGITPYSADY